jgi:sec-independent protein translocase protein TatC
MLALYTPPEIEKTLRASDYLERILQLVFAFGFAFEVPVLLTLLVRVGLVSTQALRAKRRWAIVVSFIIAAVLTPPDIVSQFALATPLLAFYEISILIGSAIEKRRAAAEKAEEAADKSSGDSPPSS